MSGLHPDQVGAEIHTPVFRDYADPTARQGDTTLVTSDLFKIARQVDDNSLWLLTAITPTWKQIAGGGTGGGVDDLNFSLHDTHTSNVNWKTKAGIVFRGTAVLGAPSIIKAVVWIDAGITSGDIRIQDITNTLTIATLNFTNTAKAILSLGTLANLPAGEAIFEVQIKKTGGTGKAYCSALTVIF